MKNKNAIEAIKNTISIGEKHHDFHEENRTTIDFLRGDENALERYINVYSGLYENVLGPIPLRALQNGVICTLTVICRQAIFLGANAEICLGLSDFFINADQL